MINKVTIKGRILTLNPAHVIGQGGEAEVYRFGQNQVLKIWKDSSHSDFNDHQINQNEARKRIDILQTKMPAFPSNLPETVVTPIELARIPHNKSIIGYTMKRVRNAFEVFHLSHRHYREKKCSNNDLIEIFTGLASSLSELHQQNIVIGDFNDLNVLVRKNSAFIIDVDSFQFGSFLCSVFTERFLDPLLCDPSFPAPSPVSPFSPDSDWYAFSVMLMRSFLFVGPYGGIYRPRSKSARRTQRQRPFQRITVFHPHVRYPKPAAPIEVLSDDLLQYFQNVFIKDRRGPFPTSLLRDLDFKKCHHCGIEHSRVHCPNCSKNFRKISPDFISKNIVASELLRTRGQILKVISNQGSLSWIEFRDDCYYRENNRPILAGSLDPTIKFYFQGPKTILEKDGRYFLVQESGQIVPHPNASSGRFSHLKISGGRLFWISGAQLLKEGRFGPESIGNILENRTIFWVGPEFGFGFYRAGSLHVSFLFSLHRPGIQDQLDFPKIRGKLIDVHALFSSEYCWFFSRFIHKSRQKIRCIVINIHGKIEAVEETSSSEIHWLAQFRNGFAIGNALFSATDEGIQRIELQNNQIQMTKIFTETEPFISGETQIFHHHQGIAVADRRLIQLLRMS